MSMRERVRGALLGLAAADAHAWPLGRLAPEEAATRRAALEGRPRVHGASTTWALSVVDSVLEARAEPLAATLALKLEVLTRAFRGAALRGGPQTAAGTLAQVGRALDGSDDETDLRSAGLDEPRADGLASLLAFGFAVRDDDDDVVSGLLDVATLTHRHPESVAAGALWAGAVRLTLRGAASDEVWEGASALAFRALEVLRTERAAQVSAPVSAGEGALAMALAVARTAPLDAVLPEGVDCRDAPARVAAAAVAWLVAGAPGALALAERRLSAGGDVDVLLPLVGIAAGLVHGASGLPSSWLDPLGTREPLATREMVEARVRALLEGERPPPLVEDEVRFSRSWHQGTPAASPSPAGGRGRKGPRRPPHSLQLKLL